MPQILTDTRIPRFSVEVEFVGIMLLEKASKSSPLAVEFERMIGEFIAGDIHKQLPLTKRHGRNGRKRRGVWDVEPVVLLAIHHAWVPGEDDAKVFMELSIVITREDPRRLMHDQDELIFHPRAEYFAK